jgi:hypothetical protein
MSLTGTFKDLSITNLVQLNCMEKKTAQIVINWKGHEGALFLLEGDIIHAKFMDLKGEQALYKILRLEDGRFSISEPKTIPERNIYDSWKGLLLEGMRVMDESEKEKDTIVRTIALDLTKHPSIEKLLITTKSREVIQNNGYDSPERTANLAAVLVGKAVQLSTPLSLGDVIYASYATGQNNTFFFECDSFHIVAEVNRETEISSLFKLVEELKGKLRVAEFVPE